MKLVKHDGPLPKTNKKVRHSRKKDPDEIFGEFIAMNVEIARIDIVYGVDYQNIRTAYESLCHASRIYPEYGVAVRRRNEEIYFVRKTM